MGLCTAVGEEGSRRLDTDILKLSTLRTPTPTSALGFPADRTDLNSLPSITDMTHLPVGEQSMSRCSVLASVPATCQPLPTESRGRA